MAQVENLKSLLLVQLQDLTDADKHLLKAWPKLGGLASAKPLKTLCKEGVSYTEERVRRLQKVAALLGIGLTPRKSDALRATVKSALAEARTRTNKTMKDAILLAGIEKISHYGMAGYGAAAEYAKALGERQAAALLRQSYLEKKDAIYEEGRMMRRSILPAFKSENSRKS